MKPSFSMKFSLPILFSISCFSFSLQSKKNEWHCNNWTRSEPIISSRWVLHSVSSLNPTAVPLRSLLEPPSAFHRTFPYSPVIAPSYLLPVILKGIVIVVDGNAKQKCTQALDKLLLFSKVFSYLPCELELLIRMLEIVDNHNTIYIYVYITLLAVYIPFHLPTNPSSVRKTRADKTLAKLTPVLKDLGEQWFPIHFPVAVCLTWEIYSFKAHLQFSFVCSCTWLGFSWKASTEMNRSTKHSSCLVSVSLIHTKNTNRLVALKAHLHLCVRGTYQQHGKLTQGSAHRTLATEGPFGPLAPCIFCFADAL